MTRTRELFQDIELVARMTGRRGIAALLRQPGRFEDMHWRQDDILLDLSRTTLTPAAISGMIALVEAAGLEAERDAWFRGHDSVIPGQRRIPAPTLRQPPGLRAPVGDSDISLELEEARHWPESLSQALRDGTLTGASGGQIRDVIHFGSAEADPGAAMVAATLGPLVGGPKVHFVTPETAGLLDLLLPSLDADHSIVILAERHFSDPAFQTCARRLRDWLSARLTPEAAQRHIFAVTLEVEAACDFGCLPERIIGFSERCLTGFSTWSPVHLGLMVAIGPEAMRELRDGAHEMDLHFRTTPAERNLGVLLGLSDIWHRDILRCAPGPIRSFDPALTGWARYAESLLPGAEPATADPKDGLRRVTEVLVSSISPSEDRDDFQIRRMAEALNAARCLSFGRDPGEDGSAAALPIVHQDGEIASGEGNQASVMLVWGQTDARTLGRLMALTEHRALVAGLIPGGSERAVEGSADDFVAALGGAPVAGQDAGTLGVMRHMMALRGHVQTPAPDGAPPNVIRFPSGPRPQRRGRSA